MLLASLPHFYFLFLVVALLDLIVSPSVSKTILIGSKFIVSLSK